MTVADILTLTRNLVGATSTTYTNANFLIALNNAYEETVGKIIGLDGTWQFDDTNFTDRPIATTTLVAGQRDYSFDSTQLEIEKVEVKDNSGNWQPMTPIDKSEYNTPLEELYSVNGLPEKYDKEGNSILIYPAAASGSVTLTAGLKIYFQRTASVFTSAEVTTGTKQPGFASPWHHILAYKAAIPYAITYKPKLVNLLESKALRLEEDLLKHYGRREKDVRKRLSNNGIGNYE